MDGDDGDDDEFDVTEFLAQEPDLAWLPYSPAFGWTPEIRALMTACLTGDARWANLVVEDLDRQAALEALMLAIGLLVVQVRMSWNLDAEDAGDVWDVLSVRLAWLTDKWEGEPITSLWEMLREA
jgi:hypothetical protein